MCDIITPMDTVAFEDFQRLDIRIAKIIKVEEIEGADKLLKLTLDVGPDGEDLGGYVGLGERTIAAGIKAWYSPEDLIGKFVPYLANLEPRELRGIMSQGMLLAAVPSHKATEGQAGGDEAILLHPDKELVPGTRVR